jgi:hypothetical protein
MKLVRDVVVSDEASFERPPVMNKDSRRPERGARPDPAERRVSELLLGSVAVATSTLASSTVGRGWSVLAATPVATGRERVGL